MTSNRRVETELVYDGYTAEERILDEPPPSSETTTEVSYDAALEAAGASSLCHRPHHSDR